MSRYFRHKVGVSRYFCHKVGVNYGKKCCVALPAHPFIRLPTLSLALSNSHLALVGVHTLITPGRSYLVAHLPPTHSYAIHQQSMMFRRDEVTRNYSDTLTKSCIHYAKCYSIKTTELSKRSYQQSTNPTPGRKRI